MHPQDAVGMFSATHRIAYNRMCISYLIFHLRSKIKKMITNRVGSEVWIYSWSTGRLKYLSSSIAYFVPWLLINTEFHIIISIWCSPCMWCTKRGFSPLILCTYACNWLVWYGVCIDWHRLSVCALCSGQIKTDTGTECVRGSMTGTTTVHTLGESACFKRQGMMI